MPRRLARRTTPQMWVAMLLTALLFAIALVLAVSKSGPDAGSVARAGGTHPVLSPPA